MTDGRGGSDSRSIRLLWPGANARCQLAGAHRGTRASRAGFPGVAGMHFGLPDWAAAGQRREVRPRQVRGRDTGEERPSLPPTTELPPPDLPAARTPRFGTNHSRTPTSRPPGSAGPASSSGSSGPYGSTQGPCATWPVQAVTWNRARVTMPSPSSSPPTWSGSSTRSRRVDGTRAR